MKKIIVVVNKHLVYPTSNVHAEQQLLFFNTTSFWQQQHICICNNDFAIILPMFHAWHIYLLLTRHWYFLPHGTNLKQGSEFDAADGTHAGLVSKGFCTHAAKTQVSTWQDESVPHVWHTDDTFCSTVFNIFIRINVLQIKALTFDRIPIFNHFMDSSLTEH